MVCSSFIDIWQCLRVRKHALPPLGRKVGNSVTQVGVRKCVNLAFLLKRTECEPGPSMWVRKHARLIKRGAEPLDRGTREREFY